MTSLTESLRLRRTAKVLADIEQPLPVTNENKGLIDALLTEAGWAPFHHPSSSGHHGDLPSPVPWRFYKLDANDCRHLLAALKRSNPTAGKILNMLAAADALLQVTWLPDLQDLDDRTEGQEFVGSLRNMEHIAAASAAVQSFLLLATEKGFQTYWSSGGILRSDAVFARLGIPENQILLGSVFLFPQDVGPSETKPGKLRDKRGSVTDWSTWCPVQDPT